MKIIYLLLTLSLFSINSFALTATTNKGHFACLKKEWLDDMLSFAVAKDEESGQSYIKRGRCLILGSGIKVTITKSSGLFGGTTQFAYKGYKFWTTIEALEYNTK